MGKYVVREDEGHLHLIRPEHIDVRNCFMDAFGNAETEASANWVVRFCQKRGNWEPFTKEEIEAFYRERGHRDTFRFNRLTDYEPYDFLVKTNEGKYAVTHEFITRCFLASPAARTFWTNPVPA